MTGRRASAGFTAVETLVALAIFGVLLGGLAYSMQRSFETFQRSTANGDINSRAARAIHRVAQELVGARQSNLVPLPAPPFGSNRLEFELPVSSVAGAVVWSDRREIAFELQGGELDNGLDDNGNGLVDEGSVVRIDSPGTADEQRTVLVNGVSQLLEGETQNGIDDNGNGLVDESGLAFVLDEGAVTVRLTLQRIGPDGELMLRTQETALALRNGVNE